MPFIAIATLIAAGASIYGTTRQEAAASEARKQAAKQAREAAAMADKQIAAQREQTAIARQQSDIARQRLQFEIGRAAEDKARVEAEAAKMAQDLETQQRQYAEQEAQRMRQLRRGGVRSLLSQERLAPELGLGNYDTSTFGAGVSLQ